MTFPVDLSTRRALTLIALSSALGVVVAAACLRASIGSGPHIPQPFLYAAAADGGVVVAYGDEAATRMALYDVKTGKRRWARDFRIAFEGELKVCKQAIYAPTYDDGVYVRSLGDGGPAGYIGAGLLPLIACAFPMSRYVFIASPYSVGLIPDVTVLGVDAGSHRTIWGRVFPERNLEGLTASADTVRVALSEGSAEMMSNPVILTLRGKDGRQISSAPAPDSIAKLIPSDLPAPTRRRLKQMLVKTRQEGDVTWQFIAGAKVLRSGDLIVVGVRDTQIPPPGSSLFGVRYANGRTVWQRSEPELQDLVLVHNILVGSYESERRQPHSSQGLKGFDPKTGRLLWTVNLSGGTRKPSPTK